MVPRARSIPQNVTVILVTQLEALREPVFGL